MPVNCKHAATIVRDTDGGHIHNATSYGEAYSLLEWPWHGSSRLLLEHGSAIIFF